MTKPALLLTVTVALAAPLYAGVTEGDAHWAKRAEGASGAKAAATRVELAIAEYRQALNEDENDFEARWKLLRAMRFKGAYVADSTAAKKTIFDDAKEIGSEGVEILESMLKSKGVRNPEKASETDVARAARAIPGAGELYYWDAVTWGEWALVYGKLAAVRQGAADRIRRESTIAMKIDPAMEGGGPARVLGRLHNQTPRIPFLTGWASDEEAIGFLKSSLELNPGDKLTQVFLAEAMVAADPGWEPEARKILDEVLSTPLDPEFLVEGASAQNDARALLASWD
ncbi:MAG: hypothetical protein KY459_16195 [Acidobacteria bacterium]|nr:hypothetical protein [Acidobacteriota bacterium]